MNECENCIEWEYFDGYGYGCFCMKTMIPIDSNECDFYADKRPPKNRNEIRWGGNLDKANKEG